MTNFEIAMLLVLIVYGVIFGIICAGLFNRTRINKSALQVTNKILDLHNARIDGVNDRLDFLVKIIGDLLEEPNKEDPKVNYAVYDSECNLICVSDHMEFDLCEKHGGYITIEDTHEICYRSKAYTKECKEAVNWLKNLFIKEVES